MLMHCRAEGNQEIPLRTWLLMNMNLKYVDIFTVWYFPPHGRAQWLRGTEGGLNQASQLMTSRLLQQTNRIH
jgi:hypothetical protein